jgi:hypothetical protein
MDSADMTGVVVTDCAAPHGWANVAEFALAVAALTTDGAMPAVTWCAPLTAAEAAYAARWGHDWPTTTPTAIAHRDGERIWLDATQPAKALAFAFDSITRRN